MTADAPAALFRALALLRSPRDARPAARERLPAGMALLLRIVGGDEQALAASRGVSGASDQDLREAAIFYVQQVLFAPGADSYRVLGVDSDADDERIKEHYRWLVRWLHPDRNPDAWEAVYADRVNRAWQDLRTRDRRQRFDESRAQAPPLAVTTTRAAPSRMTDVDPGGLSRRWLRWLPHLVFAALGASAFLAVGAYYVLRWQDSELVPSPALASTESASERSTSEMEHLSPLPLQASNASAAPARIEASVDSPVAALATPATPPSASVAATVPAETHSPADSRLTGIPRAAPNAIAAAPLRQPPVPAPVHSAETSSEAVTALRSNALQPAPSLAAAPPPAAAPSEDALAEGVLSRFQQAYAAGDIGRLEQMFVSALPGRTKPASALLEYRNLFKKSVSRRLWVQDVSWIGSGDRATIIASYQSEVWFAGDRTPRHQAGDMRLDLRRLQGDWRIETVRHD